VSDRHEPTYTVEIRTENFMGEDVETVRGLHGRDVQAVKDAAKYTSHTGDTVTFEVTEER
jgi:hypothetical protein